MPRADRDLEHLLRPRTWGAGVEVTAVEPTGAQLVWARLDEGRYLVHVGGDRLDVEHPGGAGSLALGGLRPSTDLPVRITDAHGAAVASLSLRTPSPPDGERLFRFATISDLHLGRDTHHAPRNALGATVAPDERGERAARPLPGGVTVERTDPASDRAFRCAAAAIDEAVAWGAELIVVKGDVCEETTDATWDLAASLLDRAPVPVLTLPGNHDTGTLRHFEPEQGAAERGHRVVRGVDHLDVPGLRVVAVDSTVPDSGWGDVARHADEVADLVRDAPGGAFVATHHQPQRFSVPMYWPHGIPGPNARQFARAVVAANPSVLASSGHTHRNRRRRVAGLAWSEVAATSHFPAAWAGYTVHEGGLHQTVRRITEPEVLAWSEHSRRMLGGVWALWSAGSLADRCFTLDW